MTLLVQQVADLAEETALLSAGFRLKDQCVTVELSRAVVVVDGVSWAGEHGLVAGLVRGMDLAGIDVVDMSGPAIDDTA